MSPPTGTGTPAEVVIFAGPGGVGKTTCAAAFALREARTGRNVCVVTVDPARRLADALGISGIGDQPRRVEQAGGPGELWAAMLDAKRTFDEIVRRTAVNEAQAQAILENRLYRNISGVLGGTQEYMAMEKIHALHADGRFDVLVVDTPPSRHVFDLLDAPARLLRFLDNRLFRFLMSPTRAGMRAFGGAAQIGLRGLSKVVGGQVVADAADFFVSFEGMEQGFRERAAAVEQLLGGSGTAFVVVASPHREAAEEAALLADRLVGTERNVSALVVNRVMPAFGPPPEDLSGPLAVNMADLDATARAEEDRIAALAGRLAGARVVRVPALAGDVHDLAGLGEVGRWLEGL